MNVHYIGSWDECELQDLAAMDSTIAPNWIISDKLFHELVANDKELKYLRAYGVEGWEFYAEAMVASEGHIRED